MKKNKVSIVIPVYNGQKYIEECVESLFVQTYKNIEIIVVNDGSNDDTEKILENLSKKDDRLKIINQVNSGVSVARNNGINSSTGKYITFVDSDDSVQKNYVEYLVKNMEKNDADISLTRTALKFNSTTNLEITKNDEDKIEVFDGYGAANEMLLYKIIISSWNKMFKKNFLINNNIKFNKKLSFGEGFEFAINAFLHSRRVVIGNSKIYNYRVDNANSVMTNFSRKLVTGSIDAQYSIKRMIDTVSDYGKRNMLIKSWNYSMWHTNCDCFNTIVGSNSELGNEDLYELTKKYCKKSAFNSLKCDISKKDKIKSILYAFSPIFAAKLINKFRIRHYTKER